MTSYANQEMADIHFIYGAADGNVLEVRQLYGERFPSRRLTNRKTFEPLHRRLREAGSFVSGMHDAGRTRSARTPEFEKHVLREIEEQPEMSTRTISATTSVSHMTVESIRFRYFESNLQTSTILHCPSMKIIVVFLTLVAASYAQLQFDIPMATTRLGEDGTSSITQYHRDDNQGNYDYGYNEGHNEGGSFRREGGDAGRKVAPGYPKPGGLTECPNSRRRKWTEPNSNKPNRRCEKEPRFRHRFQGRHSHPRPPDPLKLPRPLATERPGNAAASSPSNTFPQTRSMPPKPALLSPCNFSLCALSVVGSSAARQCLSCKWTVLGDILPNKMLI
ncbi:cuticle protein 14 isoform b [Trichonephila inaurata madagascariensis]|uniref:Cuticle protein 14 isoform b n=1 Tax=Trichonephila inaurata madagascariensis TaxID=2747483 RepID=A0A8X6X611_9ARAC|nr:cuticle protein 14 isoform b [Trichonephila inaurata madagascariensis]